MVDRECFLGDLPARFAPREKISFYVFDFALRVTPRVIQEC